MTVLAASERLALRRTTPEDIPFVRAAESHPENAPYVLQWTPERHAAALQDPDLLLFIVVRLPEGVPVGYGIMGGLQNPHRSVELRRIVITEKGRGIGREAVRLVKRLAFGRLGAHRLWLDLVVGNDRALHLYESEGFVREGMLRDSVLRDGVFQSFVLMSLLEHEA